MKKSILILVFLLCGKLFGQSLSVFNVDTSNFPHMKANFYAFDANGKQITNLSTSDFSLTENGINRKVTNIFCPAPKPDVPLSSVLTIDISGSMGGKGIDLAKIGGKTWVNSLNLGNSECALTGFNSSNYYICDFTDKKNKLLSAIDNLGTDDGTDYNAAFINPSAGALIAAQNGKHKKVIIFISDGGQNSEPKTQEIIKQANNIGATIYGVIVFNPAPQSVKDISIQTGGMFFENIQDESQIIEAYLKILSYSINVAPCTIEWESDNMCFSNINAECNVSTYGLKTNFIYFIAYDKLVRLDINPSGIIFENVSKGTFKDTIVNITAYNKDINITNISSSNPDFSVNPSSFFIKAGTTKQVTLRFTPITDSAFENTLIKIENDICYQNYIFARTGFNKNTHADKNTLKIISPNGGEKFIVGTDTAITYEGVLPNDSVRLDYSIDNGITWKNLTSSATNFKYLWKNVPKPTSNKCLVKASTGNSGNPSEYKDSVSFLNDFGINSIALSSKRGSLAAGCSDSTIKTMQLPGSMGLETYFTGHTGEVNSVEFSSDGLYLVSGSSDSTIKLWDFNKKTEIRTIKGHFGRVNSVAFSQDDYKLLSGASDGFVKLWDANTGAEIRTFTGHSDAVNSVAFCADGSQIISGSNDSKIILWDANTGAVIRIFVGHTNSVNSVAFSPDGKKIASGSADKTIKLWDINTGSVLITMTGHLGSVKSVIFSADGTKILSGSSDRTLKLWDAGTGSEIRTFRGHAGYVNSVVSGIFLNTPTAEFASGSADGSIKFWNSGNEDEVNNNSPIFNNTYNCVAFSPDGTKLASVFNDNNNTIKIWEVSTKQALFTLPGHRSSINSIAYSPDGNKLISGSSDSTIKLWDLNTRSEIFTLKGHSGYVNSVAYSPDGKSIISGSRDKSIKQWDVNSGALIRTFTGHLNFVQSVAFSSNGNYIISGSYDSTVKIWDVKTGGLIRTFKGHSKEVITVASCPGISLIASGSYDRTIKIWESSSGALIYDLFPLQYCYPSSLAFSPGGNILAAGISGDKHVTVKLWDMSSGNLLSTFNGYTNNANNIAYSPDGSKIAITCMKNYVLIWNLFNNNESSFNNADTSDAVFSIVEPLAAAHDIDMGQVLVGSSKDSVIKDFLRNIGSYQIRIDSIKLKNNDNKFRQVGGIPPYILDIGNSHEAEFEFKPPNAGNFSDSILIYSQSSVLAYRIIGEGVEPTIKITTNLIDFGKVEIPNKKDSTVLIIQNISKINDINISSVELMGPDKEQFEILTPGGFLLKKGDSKELNLRFKPKYIGRTSCDLGFYYSGTGSPARTQLFGTGIGGLITVSNDSAYPGEQRLIKLIMNNIKPGALQNIADRVRITLCFNGTILTPVDRGLIKQINSDTTFITIEQPLATQTDILAGIKLFAGLGDAEQTNINIVSVEFIDNTGNIVDYDVETKGGLFKLLGICREGGTRLVNPNGQAKLMSVAPNPADKTIEIEFSLNENGYSELILVNSMGEMVKIFYSECDNVEGTKKIKADVSDLSAGEYLLILQTPTYSESRKVFIMK